MTELMILRRLRDAALMLQRHPRVEGGIGVPGPEAWAAFGDVIDAASRIAALPRMPLVIVESPYASATKAGVRENETFARACLADCLRRGEAPFASHLLYTQPGVLDDKEPAERVLGIAAGLAIGAYFDKTALYLDRGVTDGMQKGMSRAEAEGRPIERRWLDPENEVRAGYPRRELIPLHTQVEWTDGGEWTLRGEVVRYRPRPGEHAIAHLPMLVIRDVRGRRTRGGRNWLKQPGTCVRNPSHVTIVPDAERKW